MDESPKITLSADFSELQTTKIIEIFSGIREGGFIEIHSDHEPKLVLRELQDKCWGTFDWCPIVREANLWVTILLKMPNNAPADTITTFMTRDHKRCDQIFVDSENAANEGKALKAVESSRRFIVAMMHHFAMEEEIFFPALEAKTGMRQGPTMVMRMEHEQMRNLLKTTEKAASSGDMKALIKTGSTMLVLMQQHNIKEEQMLYQMGDMHLRPVQKELLMKMQAV